MDKATTKALRGLFFDVKSAWLNAPAPDPSHYNDGGREDFSEWSVKPVAWGWTVRCLRSGEAAIRLSDAGLGEEASPLLRSTIEHTMYLWWLSIERGKVIEVLKRRQKHSLGKIIGAQSTGWAIDAPTLEVIQEIIDDATELHTDLDGLAHAGNLAKQYPADLGNLFQAWLYDTQTSHASLQSASAYYRTMDDRQPGGPGFLLFHEPEPNNNVVARAVVASVAALSGYSRSVGLEGYFDPKITSFTDRFKSLLSD